MLQPIFLDGLRLAVGTSNVLTDPAVQVCNDISRISRKPIFILDVELQSKRIEKESTGILKKSKNTLLFDELTSLLIRPIESPKLLFELVLICRDKPFQILISSKDILTDYANQLQSLLNLPLEIA